MKTALFFLPTLLAACTLCILCPCAQSAEVPANSPYCACADTKMVRNLNQRLLTLEQELRVLQNHRAARSDDNGPLEAVMTQLSRQVTEMAAQIEALRDANVAQDEAIALRGSTYTRWGHGGCPSSTQLVYSGIIGGSHYNKSGGGPSNYLCLTSDPTFDHHRPTGAAFSEVYGSEYHVCPETGCELTPACAVCRTPRAAAMVPAATSCPEGWALQYSGYVMSALAWADHPGNGDYICVDAQHGYIDNTAGRHNENILYYTLARCGALPCPPYTDGGMLPCVVCSK